MSGPVLLDCGPARATLPTLSNVTCVTCWWWDRLKLTQDLNSYTISCDHRPAQAALMRFIHLLKWLIHTFLLWPEFCCFSMINTRAGKKKKNMASWEKVSQEKLSLSSVCMTLLFTSRLGGTWYDWIFYCVVKDQWQAESSVFHIYRGSDKSQI